MHADHQSHGGRGADGSPAGADSAQYRRAAGSAAQRGRLGRGDWVWLVVVVGVALVIRLIYLMQLRDCPYFSCERMDAGYNDAWAKAIAAGRPFVDGPYFRAPLYPYFLGLLYRLTGTSYFAVRAIQMVIGSASCGLVYLIGRRIMSRVAAGVAALACSSYWLLVYFDGELLIPVVIIFLDLLMLLWLVRISERRTLLRCAVAGLLLGLSAIARPNVLLFAPVVAVWFFLMRRSAEGGLRLPPLPHGRGSDLERGTDSGRGSELGWGCDWQAGLVAAAAFCVCVWIPIVPVAIRNHVVGGDSVLIASQGGVNFYIGNNASASGMTVEVPGVPPTIEGIYQGTTRTAEADLGRKLKPSEVSSYYLDKSLAFWRSEPGRAMGLMLRKLACFWSWTEILNNKHIYFLTERYTPITGWLPLGFYVVGPLGLMGLVACCGAGRRMLPLWSFVVVYMISVVLFFVTARFRLPVVPVLIILGAFGVESLVGAVRSKRAWRAGVLLLVLACSVVLVSRPVRGQTGRGQEEQALVDLGKVLLDQGKPDEAVALMSEAAARRPDDAGVAYALGVTLEDAGRDSEAETAYRRAIACDADHVSALNNLGRLYLRLGRPGEALPLLERAVSVDPRHTGARFNLGRALDRLGRLDGAAKALREGLALAPARADVWDVLARILVDLKRYKEAVGALEKGLKIETSPEEQALRVRMLILYGQLRSTIKDRELLDCESARGACYKAVELTNMRDWKALDALAAAYANCDEWLAAVDSASAAIELARKEGETQAAEAIEKRRELYRKQQKFRMTEKAE